MTSPSCAGQPGKGGGGSCADGQQKPWEQGPPSDGEPGLEQHEAERIVQAVAKRIESSTRGRGKGGFAGWACEILNPKVDPRAKLLKAVRRAVEFTTGTGEYSYRRPSRRNPRPDMCLPSGVQPVPRITVVVDTSGSMGDRDTGLSLGLVAKVLNGFRIRDGIRVLCFDDGLQSAQRVFNPKQIQLAGRGGTDMTGAIVEAAKERRKPELIVVCTDGWTGWPEAPVGVPVVACITRAETVERVPKWIETISLGD